MLGLVRDMVYAAFVPTFTRTLTNQGRADAWRLGSLVISALIIVTGGIVLLGVVFAEQLAWLFASDYAGVPGHVSSGLSMMLMLNVPARVGLVSLAGPMSR